MAAIDMHNKKSADVLFGPVYEYSISHVAEYAEKWNLPYLTSGGLVTSFDSKEHYKMLTRVQGPYKHIGEFFSSIMKYFKWKKIGIMHHNKGHSRPDCYYKMEALFLSVRDNINSNIDNSIVIKFDQDTSTDMDKTLKLKKLSTFSRGKINGLEVFTVIIILFIY